MERSPKLRSDNIDQVSPLIALSVERTEPELESTPLRQRRLYGLEFLSSSPHDGIRYRTERMDEDEDVVLMEAQSVSLERDIVLKVVLIDEGIKERSVLVVRSVVSLIEKSLVSSDESGCSLISSRSCTATSLFDSDIFSHIFSTSSCRLESCCEASFVELLRGNDKNGLSRDQEFCRCPMKLTIE